LQEKWNPISQVPLPQGLAIRFSIFRATARFNTESRGRAGWKPKGPSQMRGSTCKKNARGFRKPRPGKDLRSEKKISCRYALSSRRGGQAGPEVGALQKKFCAAILHPLVPQGVTAGFFIFRPAARFNTESRGRASGPAPRRPRRTSRASSQTRRREGITAAHPSGGRLGSERAKSKGGGSVRKKAHVRIASP